MFLLQTGNGITFTTILSKNRPVGRKTVCRIEFVNYQFKKINNKTNDVGIMKSVKRASEMSLFRLVLRGSLAPLLFASF